MGRPSELNYVENPTLKHLESLGWNIIQLDETTRNDPEKTGREDLRQVILPRVLFESIKRLNPWLTNEQVKGAIIELQNYSYSNNKLLENNKEVFTKITECQLSAIDEETGISKNISLIDFSEVDKFDKENPKNSFIAVSQFKVQIPHTEQHIIPDIILFVNGLPLVVIECKAPDIETPVAEGIEQLLRYQNRRDENIYEGVPELFFYNQLVISTSGRDAKYSTITGFAPHFLEWKDPYPYATNDPIVTPDGGVANTHNMIIAGMLEPSHLLDIVNNFTVFMTTDEGYEIKIAPRYMQYRGANIIIEKLRGNKKYQAKGTIWHTQGTGKSLTMIFVVRKMQNSTDLNHYKIVLIVDRTDLQKQLKETSKANKHRIETIASINDVTKSTSLLRSQDSNVVIAMIHKFGTRGDNVNSFGELNNSKNILVMIDEAHRSEYSALAANMWAGLPNATKIAFTGTPISKTTESFGGYLDAYTMARAVEDGIVVDITYEGRATQTQITDAEELNQGFLDVFGYADTDEQQKIINRYTVRGYLEAEEQIRRKASDMLDHYIKTIFTNGFKAQVVGTSIEAAHRYKSIIEELLPKKIAELEQNNPLNVDIEKLKKLKVACIISASSNDKPYLKEYSQQDNDKIVDGFKAPFGKTGKKGGDGNYGIICVTAMLLTGFDAPIEQVMYLDKIITGHNLLQAIARVNRTAKQKTCGYLVDYVGVTNHLTKALAEYNDPTITDVSLDDIISSLSSKEKHVDALNKAYNELQQFFSDKFVGLQYNNDIHTRKIIEELIADDELYNDFMNKFGFLSRMYDKVLPNPEALKYLGDYKRLAAIKEAVNNVRNGTENFTNRDTSDKVRAIIEEYLQVEGINQEIAPLSILSPDFLDDAKRKNKTDKMICKEIEYKVRQFININLPKDPELYQRLSEKLEEILSLFKNNWEQLRIELETIRQEVIDGRTKEKNYGFDPEKEMPFLALIKTEIFGESIKLENLTEEQLTTLTDLVNDVLSRLKTDAAKVGFWQDDALKAELRTHIINQIISGKIQQLNQSVFSNRKSIAQKIIELGSIHYGGESA
jgi:type I restriction enzyme R subunit